MPVCTWLLLNSWEVYCKMNAFVVRFLHYFVDWFFLVFLSIIWFGVWELLLLDLLRYSLTGHRGLLHTFLTTAVLFLMHKNESVRGIRPDMCSTANVWFWDVASEVCCCWCLWQLLSISKGSNCSLQPSWPGRTPQGYQKQNGHLFVVLSCDICDLVPRIESMREIVSSISHLASLFYEPVLNSKGCIQLLLPFWNGNGENYQMETTKCIRLELRKLLETNCGWWHSCILGLSKELDWDSHVALSQRKVSGKQRTQFSPPRKSVCGFSPSLFINL